jgi:hypothetical protein
MGIKRAYSLFDFHCFGVKTNCNVHLFTSNKWPAGAGQVYILGRLHQGVSLGTALVYAQPLPLS